MARWQLSASAVMIARFSDSISSSFGTAVISFDVSSVATCARTNREPAAQALTKCNGDRSAARSKERRSVLPSIAITPWAASAKPSMNCRKQAWNFAGLSRRNTRLKVSWLGIPCRSCRNCRRNGSLARPKRALSEQSSPPQSTVQKAIIRISSRSCRALSPRGSSSSAKQAANSSMDPPPMPEFHGSNRRLVGPQALTSYPENQMRFPCLHVFSKLFDDGLERGQEAEAFSRRQIGGHDDVLEFLVGHLINVEMTRQPAP